MAAPAAAQGKKGKKKGKNFKTVSLNDFLGDTAAPGVIKQLDWADEAEEEFLSVNNSFTYQTTANPKTITLPTAPKASRSVEVDLSRISDSGPFTAFVGNLPYETSQETLENFFKGLKIVNVRLPEENGRFKGFGYVEFADKLSLIEALKLNEETFHKRTIRIDIADNQNKAGAGTWGNRGGDRYGRDGGPDPTASNWRSAAARDFTSNRSGFEQRDTYHGRRNERRGGGFGDYGYDDRYEDQRRQRNDPYYDRGQRSSYNRGSSYQEQDGNWRRSSQGYDQDRRYGDDRSSNSRYGGRDRYGGGGGGYDRDGYNRGGYGSRSGFGDRDGYSSRGSYNRQRSDEMERRDEKPRERPRLQLQPRQKPLDDGNTAVDGSSRSSSIFGAAKPVDTSAREKTIEEKLLQEKNREKANVAPEKKSGNIFGSARPVDTTAREREIEEKMVLKERKLLEESQQKSKPPSQSASIFGNAKPVDTAARERAIEDKIRKQEQSMLDEYDERDDASGRYSRRSSDKNDDYYSRSPKRRSRTSSTRSTEEQEVFAPHQQQNRTRNASGSAREPQKPEYKPAPPPKENAWGRKKFNPNTPPQAAQTSVESRAAVPAERSDNAWTREASKLAQRGEREEAEGNSREDEEEERTPEGAADDESKPTQPRNEPGDGRESTSQYRQAHYSSSDRTQPAHDRRKYDGKQSYDRGNKAYGRQYSSENRNRDRDFNSNRRRGDGDSESYRSDRHYSDRSQANRPQRDNRSSKSENTDTKRDSSGDSRPECDRPDAAGQEQAPKGKKSHGRSKPSAPPVLEDTPVNFATRSKFALLSVDDSGDDDSGDDATNE